MPSGVNHQNMEDFNEPLRGYTGFDLTICSSSHDSGYVFINTNLAENKYFRNHRGRTEHKIMDFKF